MIGGIERQASSLVSGQDVFLSKQRRGSHMAASSRSLEKQYAVSLFQKRIYNLRQFASVFEIFLRNGCNGT